MRNISATSLAKISQHLGGEPVVLVTVYWAPGVTITYSDRLVKGIPIIGRLLEVSNLENVVDISRGSNSKTVTIKLDDVNGDIKNIFNNVDIHKKPVLIQQWYSDIPLSDAFTLFYGLISSPIEWKEGDRTISFDVLSKLEDREIGFSVEDGDFINVPAELIGKPWPLCFGTCINVPALRIDRIPSGATLVPVGITNNKLQNQAEYIDCQADKQLAVAACLSRVGANLEFQGEFLNGGKTVFEKGQQFQQRAIDMINQVSQQLRKDQNRINRITDHQTANYDINPIPIINGHRFFQNIPVGIKIGKLHYYGVFYGDNFFVISRFGPNDVKYEPGFKPAVFTPGQVSGQSPTDLSKFGPGPIMPNYTGSIIIEDPQSDFLVDAIFDTEPDDFITPTKKDKQEDPCGPHNLIIVPTGVCAQGGTGTKKTSSAESGKFEFEQAGAAVKPDFNYPLRHVVNIIAGTVVLGVAAYRTFGGVKTLVAVPTSYYTVSEVPFRDEFGVGITATIITLLQPLSAIEGEDWGEELYVTLRSPIGPNIADIIQYIINTWGGGIIADPTTFAAVRPLLAPFPANFALLTKKNLVNAVKEIAYQARCLAWLDNGFFYIKYLPATASPTESITESDVDSKSLEVTTTPTEDVYTKYVVDWQNDYSVKEKNKVILFNNVGRYGIHEKRDDFYIYNEVSLVDFAATFWLIRYSNTWKRLKFKTPIQKLRIETVDTVTMDFSHNYVSNAPVDCICEKAQINSADYTVDFEFWVPIRLGEMVPYSFAFPADVTEFTWADINQEAGTFPPNSQANGDLSNGGPTFNVVHTNKAKGHQTNDTQAADNTPNLQTTIGNYVPSGVGQNVMASANGGKPSYGDNTNKPFTPMERPKLIGLGATYPGQVQGPGEGDPAEGDGQVYSVLIFPDGLGKDGTLINATQLQIDNTETIPVGTWVTVTSTIAIVPTEGGDPTIKAVNIMQLPIWLSDS